jgi:Apg6 BARA domain
MTNYFLHGLVFRVALALDADSERLVSECFMYGQAARQEEERYESLEKALRAVVVENNNNNNNDDDSHHHFPTNTLQKAEQAFLDEITALEEECQQQEAELWHLKALKEEQLALAKEMDETEYELEVERNSLELEARAFDNDQRQLSQVLQDINDEVDKLSSGISLPSLLLDLQVDERGLRYPFINELRLAYRPKGDLKWNEVQVAWSLAAQLLLVVGTLFQYPSEQWKIVPLSHCAKLIFYSNNENDGSIAGGSHEIPDKARAVVYHLGHPRTNGATAIRACNRVLHQVILHVRGKTEVEYSKKLDVTAVFPNVPFAISPTTIGSIDLTQLSENDDAGWSKAIHFMASNLLWLSECAAIYTSHQVLWTSAVLEAFKS